MDNRSSGFNSKEVFLNPCENSRLEQIDSAYDEFTADHKKRDTSSQNIAKANRPLLA